MSLAWNMAEDRLWFARWDDQRTGLRLYAVVENVPCRDQWDWEIWLPDEPKIAKCGIARSSHEAINAARRALEECLTISAVNFAWP